MVIYLDLDGTLLDVSERYWALHLELTKRHGLPSGDRERFWTLKRSRAPLAVLLGGDGGTCQAYWADWLRLIEAPEYLAKDTVIPGACEALAQLAGRHRLVLATMRKGRAALDRQLAALGLRDLLSDVRCEGECGVSSKLELVASLPCGDASQAVVVGDTEADIEAGKALGMLTVGVLTGLRDRETLSGAQPRHLVGSVRDVPAVIERSSRLIAGTEAGPCMPQVSE